MMQIKKLEKLRRLTATPTMMRLAAADEPRHVKEYGREKLYYKRSLYMRCNIQNGILVVAFFLPEYLRTGGRQPSYELFIHRESDQFITRDGIRGMWSTAMLMNLDVPGLAWIEDNRWMKKSEHEQIKEYLGVEDGGFKGLHLYQQKVRADELTRRHKKETDPWDLDLAQVPDLPKDWNRWVRKVGIPENYIYYRYNKKGADTGFCTSCERDVPIKQPRHNKEGYCPRCRHKITFKSVGKAGTVVTERYPMYLIQRCRDGFVIREFFGFRKYPQGGYTKPECANWEMRRSIYDKNAKCLTAYCWGRYKNQYERWIKNGPCHIYWSGDEAGKVYGKTLPSLAKNELRCTGLREIIRDSSVIDPEKYLAILAAAPYLEKIAKAKC
jgi:DNA-directed RNA polymerase subunit RPC12/RpoP